MIPQALIVAVIVAGLAGFVGGTEFTRARWNAEKLEQARDAHRAQERAFGIATTYESQRAEARVVERVVTQEVERVVEKPVYRSVCLDDDGLRVLSDAIAGHPAEPDGAVPSIDPAR